MLRAGLKEFAVNNPVTRHVALRRMIVPVDANNPPNDFTQGAFVIFIGGGKGSGKSTLMDVLFEELAAEGYDRRYVGKIGSFAFEPILQLPLIREIRPHLNKKAKSLAHNPDRPSLGSLLVDRALETSLTQKSPIIIDYHMDDERYVHHVLAKAKKQGYESILISPHISAEKYFERVAARHQRTGRPFNVESGLASHKGFAERIEQYIAQFDVGIFLSNNQDHMPPTPIATTTPSSREIYDAAAYGEMFRKAGINIHARTASELYPEPSAAHTEQRMFSIERTMGRRDHEAQRGAFVRRLMERLETSDHARQHHI